MAPITRAEPDVVRMSDVKPESVDWLWYPYIPIRKVTLIEGDPGIGKSWATLAITTAVSLGSSLCGPKTGAAAAGPRTAEPANVLLLSAEDGLGDTIRPRLDSLGADSTRIFAAAEPFTFDQQGLATLESYAREVKPRLIVIDPLVAYLGAGTDMHRANEVRPLMASISGIAARADAAVLAVRHLVKAPAGRGIYSGIGSIDFAASARSIILVGCDPDDASYRGLVHIKSNLAKTGAAVGYSLKDGSFAWTGESSLTEARILARQAESESKLTEAVAFLQGYLSAGPAREQDIADATDISKRTLHRAKKNLGVKSYRLGEVGRRGGGAWYWALPDESPDHEFRPPA